MNRVKNMAEEIEAAEQKIFNKPTRQGQAVRENRGSEEKEKPTDEVIVEPETEETPLEKDASVQHQPEQKIDVDDYKSRFTNYKAATDATIAGLRQITLSKDEEIQELRAKLTEARKTTVGKDPLENLFSDEEKDLIGEETLAALRKAQEALLENKLKPLEKELEEERKRRLQYEKARIEREKKELQSTFLQKLERLVPDYRKIDLDPKFAEWMQRPDVASGYSRVSIFKSAQNSGDVGRVAEFFKQFIAETTPKDRLANKVTPVGQGTGNVVEKKPKTSGLTLKDINQFYTDVSRGRYRNRPKELQEMERRIDNHLRKLGMDRKS